jgi:hypothetical protein
MCTAVTRSGDDAGSVRRGPTAARPLLLPTPRARVSRVSVRGERPRVGAVPNVGSHDASDKYSSLYWLHRHE